MDKKVPILILAGGVGSRLAPLTDNCPKILVPFMGATFLEHLLNYIQEDMSKIFHSGYTPEVFISTGYLSHQIRAFLPRIKNNYRFDIKVIEETKSLGTGGAIFNAFNTEEFENWIVMNGDIVTNISLVGLYENHISKPCSCTIAGVMSGNVSRFGMIEHSGSNINSYIEKPQNAPHYGMINSGIYCINSYDFQGMTPGEAFSIERDIFVKYHSNLRLYHREDSYIKDIGTLKSYKETQLSIGHGRSIVYNDASIGARTSIDSSIIMEKCSIGDDCIIEDCIICENCCIEKGSVLKGICLGADTWIQAKML